MTDPWDEVYLDALDYCGSRVAAPAHYGSPILVSMLEKTGVRTLVYPPCVLRPGMPVVDLVVQPDGVTVVSRRHRVDGLLSSTFHRFPLLCGGPTLSGWQGAQWHEALDIDLTVALLLLPPLAGSALAGP